MSLMIPEKDVLLAITGTHTTYGEEPEQVELATAGKLIVCADGFDVVYEESELTGMEGTTTTFRIRGEEALLEENLPGYRDYEAKVRWRLIPFLW